MKNNLNKEIFNTYKKFWEKQIKLVQNNQNKNI